MATVPTGNELEGRIDVPAVTSESISSDDSTRMTLNEPISTTFMRDLRRVGGKLRTVLLPMNPETDTLRELRDWDMWGPLLICLTLSMCVLFCTNAPSFHDTAL